MESKRLTGFLIGLTVALSLFLAAMGYTTTDAPDSSNAEKKSQMEKLNDITQMRTVGEGEGTTLGNGKDGNANDDTPDLQPVAVDNNDNPLNFRVVEQLPEFPGGMAAFVKWLTDNLHYPALAQRQNIQGRVVVTFIINRDGSTSDLKIAKSVNPMPCRTLFAIPIEFKI